MIFRRTESGLCNLYLFFGVDAVVFLEGGNSLAKELVENGYFSDASPDIRFWQTLFRIYRPGKKYQFRSIGSKETVKDIAVDVIEGRVNNVIVAMDRDFDNIKNQLIIADNVVYTKGYSWENDAWTEHALVDAFCTLSGACSSSLGREAGIIKDYFQGCWSKLRWSIRIDAILSQHDSSLFDRKSYMRYLHIENSGKPKVNMVQLKKSIAEARDRVGRPVYRRSEIALLSIVDCFGHMFAEFAYRILTYLLERVRRLPKMPKEYAVGMVVEKFGRLLEHGALPELSQHYDNEFARVRP